MKLVNESIKDILKPKSGEEIKIEIDKITGRVQEFIKWFKDYTEFIEGLPPIEEEERQTLIEQGFQRWDEIYYNIPEFMRKDFDDEFLELRNELDALV